MFKNNNNNNNKCLRGLSRIVRVARSIIRHWDEIVRSDGNVYRIIQLFRTLAEF